MRQSAFKRIEYIVRETGEAFHMANDNGEHMNCDHARFIARRVHDIGRVLRDPAITAEKLARLIREADHDTPLHAESDSWAAHVVDYIDKNA